MINNCYITDLKVKRFSEPLIDNSYILYRSLILSVELL